MERKIKLITCPYCNKIKNYCHYLKYDPSQDIYFCECGYKKKSNYYLEIRHFYENLIGDSIFE